MAVSQEKMDQLVDSLSELSILDMSKLVERLEEKWGVSAAVAVAAAPAGAGAEEAKVEKTEFDVVLAGVQEGKPSVNVIKALRGVNKDLSLMDAKKAVDGSSSSPYTALQAVSKADAEAAVKALSEAGAKAELK